MRILSMQVFRGLFRKIYRIFCSIFTIGDDYQLYKDVFL